MYQSFIWDVFLGKKKKKKKRTRVAQGEGFRNGMSMNNINNLLGVFSYERKSVGLGLAMPLRF